MAFQFYNDIETTKIKDLYQISLNTFHDNRGEIWTIFKKSDWLPDFVEDKISISNKGVLRGLHGDDSTWKLISCLSGEFLLVVADARKHSDTYGKIEYFKFSDKCGTLVLVPPGCLNGHLCLSERCIFWYKWSESYIKPENQATVAWDDPTLDIKWPTNNPILSERDKKGKAFKDISLIGVKNEYKVPLSERNNK
jgi:dTDP-4-dehydrorhamnose 3,5-epimerase